MSSVFSKGTKVFVSAYACEPYSGSEIGVGWHWVLEMSKYFELWVLTRESNRKNIEPWIDGHPGFSNIHWIYYDLPHWARWWKRGLRGVRIYYNLWQWRSDRIVKRVMKEDDIRVFHHLTYGNALWKVSSYGQKQTFIWGPVGGLETVPYEFSRHYDLKWRVVESIRRTVIRILPLHRGFRRRCRNADLIFCKTEDTMMLIPEKYRGKAVLMTDVAVDDKLNSKACSDKNNHNIRFLTVGRLDAWRGFDLVIEAFSLLAEKRSDVELTIVGRGSDGERLWKLISGKVCKDKIVMAGQVSRSEYLKMMSECDVVVNGALKEGAVTVAFDAIANGKPQVCIETGGFSKSLVQKISAVVPKGSREQVIAGLSLGMERFCTADERVKAGVFCSAIGKKLNWEEKGKAIWLRIQEINTFVEPFSRMRWPE